MRSVLQRGNSRALEASLTALVLLLSTVAFADETASTPSVPASSVVRVEQAPKIDGALDEAVWATADPITRFQRFQPVDGPAPPGTTDVRFLQDDRFLYIGITVKDTGYGVRARISPRERINADDQVGVYLDTFHDGRSGYIFYFNPLGIQQDIRMNAGNWNSSWDTAYTSRGRVIDDGYEIEIALPWRSIKYQKTETQDWGLILTRKIPQEGAKYGYPVLKRGHPQWFTQAATLEGVQPNLKGSGLELIPSLTLGQTWPRIDDAGNEDWTGIDPVVDFARPSLDMRYGITPDIGLTGTVNPDFSQVESDVSDVRLNARFAFQFPERRPFFLDGIDYYQDIPRTLYTRSINDPLYGIKLSGRDQGLSVGVLNAVDRTPIATFTEGGTEGFNDDQVEGKWASNTVARIRGDAFGAGYIGMVYAEKRLFDSPNEGRGLALQDTPESNRDNGANQVLGIDARFPMGNRWSGTASTNHSFTGLADSHQTYGHDHGISVERASGIGTGFEAYVIGRDGNFRREMGFLTQSNIVNFGSELNHTFTPDGVIDTYMPIIKAHANQEMNGDYWRFVGTEHAFQVGGIHNINLSGGWRSTADEGFAVNDGWNANAEYRSELTSFLTVNPEFGISRGIDYEFQVPAQDINISLETAIRPTAGIRIDTTARLNTHAPEGNDLQRATLLRNRVTWQFTRELGMRLVTDWADGNVFDPQLANSLLLTWLRVPGTAVYAGYSETASLVDGYDTTERTIFAKASVLIRP